MAQGPNGGYDDYDTFLDYYQLNDGMVTYSQSDVLR